MRKVALSMWWALYAQEWAGWKYRSWCCWRMQGFSLSRDLLWCGPSEHCSCNDRGGSEKKQLATPPRSWLMGNPEARSSPWRKPELGSRTWKQNKGGEGQHFNLHLSALDFQYLRIYFKKVSFPEIFFFFSIRSSVLQAVFVVRHLKLCFHSTIFHKTANLADWKERNFGNEKRSGKG